MTYRCRTNRRRSRAQSGHTLLEWMIAAALGLVVIGGALMLYRSQRETFLQAADDARMREAGATALMLVGQHLQMAGYAPVDRPALRTRVTPGVFGCESERPTASGSRDEPSCESQSAFSASSASSAYSADSDGLVVRYVDDAIATWPTRSEGEPTDCLGQGVASTGEYAVIVNRFYVAQPRWREEPELYCGGNGRTDTPQPIVAGIDRLTIHYWLHGAAEPVRARAVGHSQWADVVAADLCVVVRGWKAGRGKHYVDCDGARAVSRDGRARLALSRHIVLRNQEGLP